MVYQRVSLKVCEGCGTLWFRQQMRTGVYCGPCVDILQHFPDPKTRLRPGRPRKATSTGTMEGSFALPTDTGSFESTENMCASAGGL
jgi:hypothetical protein